MRFQKAVMALVLATAGACGNVAAGPGEEPSGDQPPTGDAPIVDWQDQSKRLELSDGWVIAACEGDAPILCASRNGVVEGGVEATAWEISSFPEIDPEADAATQLADLAAGFLDEFRRDRREGCGTDYLFEAIDPKPFVLANLPGMSYGFVGTMPDGRPSELNLQYSAIVQDEIVTVAAIAYDEGGCPGRDDLGGFVSESLAELRPHLEEALHESPLPSLGR